MTIPALLNVAIGLILIYLVLSLIASEMQELITIVLEWRAQHLKESIAYLLSETEPLSKSRSDQADSSSSQTKSTESSLVQQLYRHPLIQALNHKAKERANSKGPSYIGGDTFALALLETLHQTSPSQLGIRLDDVIESINQTSIPPGLKTTLRIFAQQARSKVNSTDAEIQQFQQEISDWFDRSMERASGVYKRNAKGLALIIGIVMAIAANVDSLYIINTLSHDRVLQASVAQIADQVIANHTSEIDCLEQSIDTSAKNQCLETLRGDMNVAFDSLSRFPIGWDIADPWSRQLTPFTPLKLAKVIFGWFISGIAISMGAPFWFSLLNRVVSIRSTGKNK